MQTKLRWISPDWDVPAAVQSAGHKAFEDAGRASDKVDFFQTTDASLAKLAGLTKEGVVLARKFEGGYCFWQVFSRF